MGKIQWIQLWNERKSLLLIWLELLVVSVLLWYMVDALHSRYRMYRQPVGFDIKHVYNLQVGVIPQESASFDTTEAHVAGAGDDYLALLDRLDRHPSVEAICYTQAHFHYHWANRFATFLRGDTGARQGFVRFVTPDYFRVFRVKTAEGGDPEELARALRDREIVVTKRVAECFFGTAREALQSEIACLDQGSLDTLFYRIGGVTEGQRYGEYTDYDYAYYKPLSSTDVMRSGIYANGYDLFIRVKPQADGPRFAEAFHREMREQLSLGNFYLKKITPMSEIRSEFLKSFTDDVRLYIACVGFFLLNVLLGVVGTFWSRTQQRRSEIGLRMAMGASRRVIFGQLLMEGMGLLLSAFLPAMVVALNLLYMDVVQTVEMAQTWALRIGIGMAISFGLLAAMVCIGIAFPARSAMRVRPAEALRAS